MNCGIVILLSCCTIAFAGDWSDLVHDRVAIERVYQNHRLGNKPPFDQAGAREMAIQLVRQDLNKEATLKKVYGIAITSAQLDAEVQRINLTTRAPEILTNLKAALDNDTARFARTVAKPLLVERLLRERFDNDDKLHAIQRQKVEQTRKKLIAAKESGAGCDQLLTLFKESHSNAVTETTWQLGAKPAETNKPNAELADVQKRFGPNAQILSSPQSGKVKELYFEDLPPQLQKVLRIQLREPGDVSAVIEMSGGFLLYLAKQRTNTALTVLTLSVPKQNYEQWVESNQ